MCIKKMPNSGHDRDKITVYREGTTINRKDREFGGDLSRFLPKETGLSEIIYCEGNWMELSKDWGPQLYVKHWDEEQGGFGVSLTDDPQVVHGVSTITEEELEKVKQWIKMNRVALLRHWDKKTYTGGLMDEMRRLDGENYREWAVRDHG